MRRSPHDLAAAYGLDGLEGIERLGFESHLQFCPGCQDDVVDIRDASELLSVGVTLAPPGALRERVLAYAELTESPGAVRAAAEAEAAALAAAAAEEVALPQPRRRRWLGKD